MGSPRFARVQATLTSMFPGLLPGEPLLFHKEGCALRALALRSDRPGEPPVCGRGLFELRFAAFTGHQEPLDPPRPLF